MISEKTIILNEIDDTIFPIKCFTVYIKMDNEYRSLIYVESKDWIIEFTVTKYSVCDVRVISYGSDEDTHYYIIKNITRWLKKPFVEDSDITMLQQCQAFWRGLNQEETDEHEGDSTILNISFNCDVLSSDEEPACAHVKSGDWDILTKIEDGSIIHVLSEGKNHGVREYVEKNINTWFDSTSDMNKKLSNREVAQLLWDCLHEAQDGNEEIARIKNKM